MKKSIRERFIHYKSSIRKGLRSVADDIEETRYQTQSEHFTTSAFFDGDQDTSPYNSSFNTTNLFYY
eukprot:CAMPEP_0116142452 /NCGR_PEP_ID=MMETSP0329-20121206/14918_1 /TAXON_ID=697910 /ORGANISM="Pseudo-nitzschia arenysensis, Strain B593" /LENGTH=66 /DNA_ID=CAMNT_0003637693 /DNA_START=168 /DNA_END=368 /DNA_ORIENTATION=-